MNRIIFGHNVIPFWPFILHLALVQPLSSSSILLPSSLLSSDWLSLESRRWDARWVELLCSLPQVYTCPLLNLCVLYFPSSSLSILLRLCVSATVSNHTSQQLSLTSSKPSRSDFFLLVILHCLCCLIITLRQKQIKIFYYTSRS